MTVRLTATARAERGNPAEEKGSTTSAIVPLGNSGTIAVTDGGLPGAVDLVVDAVGYFQ